MKLDNVKFLVIGRNDKLTHDVAEILKMEYSGCEVWITFDSVSGCELAKQHKPDAIMCWLALPELDGFGLLRYLYQNPDFKKTTVILVTEIKYNRIVHLLRQHFEDDIFVNLGILESPFTAEDWLVLQSSLFPRC